MASGSIAEAHERLQAALQRFAVAASSGEAADKVLHAASEVQEAGRAFDAAVREGSGWWIRLFVPEAAQDDADGLNEESIDDLPSGELAVDVHAVFRVADEGRLFEAGRRAYATKRGVSDAEADSRVEDTVAALSALLFPYELASTSQTEAWGVEMVEHQVDFDLL